MLQRLPYQRFNSWTDILKGASVEMTDLMLSRLKLIGSRGFSFPVRDVFAFLSLLRDARFSHAVAAAVLVTWCASIAAVSGAGPM